MNTPADFGPQIHTVLNGISPLPQLGVIQAQGEDAAHFLHNQLSNDVLLLPLGQSRLAAFVRPRAACRPVSSWSRLPQTRSCWS